MAKEAKEKDRPSVYQVVTERVCALLEAGTVPWHLPWVADAAGARLPMNLASRRPYRGVNVFVLACQGFASPYWLTFHQCKQAGGSVRKGEHGTPVILWRWVDKEDPKTGETKSIPLHRVYTVFNVDQCTGLGDLVPTPDDVTAPTPQGATERAIAIAEAYMQSGGPGLVDGPMSLYDPSADVVAMPDSARFESLDAYCSVLFHELAHSTGHPTRLDREGEGDSGDAAHRYAFEELVAEMSAAYLCAHAGIDVAPVVENQAAYLDHWLGFFRQDPRALVNAAQRAQKAADLILGVHPAEASTSSTAAA